MFFINNLNKLLVTGDNSYGQLGIGDDVDIDNGYKDIGMTNVKEVLGSMFSILLKNDGTVWTCGRNDHGQLGLGDYDNRSTFTQVPGITDAVGIYGLFEKDYSLILKSDGTLWSSGSNGHDNAANDTTSFVYTGIDNVKKVITKSRDAVFIIKNDNTALACGINNHGQLGNGNENNINVPTSIDTSDVMDIMSNNRITLMIYGNGEIHTTGNNGDGQLGLGDTTDRNTFTDIGLKTKINYATEYSIDLNI